jgi:hypothetical protein
MRHDREWKGACKPSSEGLLPLTKLEPDPGVVRQILGHFVQNRKAADTLEGIARWRLLQEDVRRSVQQTEKALEWLVDRGLIEEVKLAGSEVPAFCLNAERYTEAVSFLAGQKKNKRR